MKNYLKCHQILLENFHNLYTYISSIKEKANTTFYSCSKKSEHFKDRTRSAENTITRREKLIFYFEV